MKIAVLTSGGVDSSVALKLLKNEDHDVTACYIKVWLEDELTSLGKCPWEEDLDFVRQICRRENIPLKIVSLQKEYWDKVVAYTIKELKSGRTPNPDIMCNKQIKFGLFYDKIDKQFEKVATGHYAQLNRKNNKEILIKSADRMKDQTYFLSSLSQKQLNRALFPIGHLNKDQVRRLAKKFNLPNWNRKDSQGICFLGKIKFKDFVKYHLKIKKGPIIEIETNDFKGRHNGYWFYTIGQRQGLGLSGGPWFVVNKDCKNNRIYISRRLLQDGQEQSRFNIGKIHWISGNPPRKRRLQVKVRHGEEIYPCEIIYRSNSKAEVKIQQKDSGIAPGQFAVFYDRDICLGSGKIL